jgi:hypothetical protein
VIILKQFKSKLYPHQHCFIIFICHPLPIPITSSVRNVLPLHGSVFILVTLKTIDLALFLVILKCYFSLLLTFIPIRKQIGLLNGIIHLSNLKNYQSDMFVYYYFYMPPPPTLSPRDALRLALGVLFCFSVT